MDFGRGYVSLKNSPTKLTNLGSNISKLLFSENLFNTKGRGIPNEVIFWLYCLQPCLYFNSALTILIHFTDKVKYKTLYWLGEVYIFSLKITKFHYHK